MACSKQGYGAQGEQGKSSFLLSNPPESGMSATIEWRYFPGMENL
jgi:hypothetical protein